jgi:hypothetical protein
MSRPVDKETADLLRMHEKAERMLELMASRGARAQVRRLIVLPFVPLSRTGVTVTSIDSGRGCRCKYVFLLMTIGRPH